MNQKTIIVQPRQSIICPSCQSRDDWWIIFTIERGSRLIRVDGLGDLLIEQPDNDHANEALELKCVSCGDHFHVQAGVECYWNGNGGETGIGLNTRAKND